MRPENAAPDFDHALDRAIAGELVSDAGLDQETERLLAEIADSSPFAHIEQIRAARAAFARSQETD